MVASPDRAVRIRALVKDVVLCSWATHFTLTANLFVGYIEHQYFNQYKPELYRRYIDYCVGATSSSREELNQFITAVNSFHSALKYTWGISDTPLAFLDIKVSIEGNGLCTSVPDKPTDSHSYLFLRLRRLCSEDSGFSLRSEEMCDFFDKRGYLASNKLIGSEGPHPHPQRSTESHKTLEQKYIFQIGSQSLRCKRTLFIQLIYSVVFHVSRHQPIA